MATREAAGNWSRTVIGALWFDRRLVFQHDRNVVPHRIDAVTANALEPAPILFENYLRLADRTDQDLQKLFADWHGTDYFINA